MMPPLLPPLRGFWPMKEQRYPLGTWRSVPASEYFHWRFRHDSRLVLWTWDRMLEKTRLVWKAR